ncbi:MAG: conjugal transfer protein TraL [Oscillospiraceae bacterium]|nr:conjugal transfer protein TraL [Oscillospiraceae bacterium]
MGFAVYLLLALEALFALLLLKWSGCLQKKGGWIVSVLLVLLAFAARAYVFDYETLDYRDFLTKWVDFFRTNGHFAALRHSVGNYNIPYLYFLALFSLSSVKDLYLIKLLSTFFDLVLAWSSMMLLGRFTRRVGVRLACFFTVLFLPTVFLNSAVWAQCDSTYAAMLVLSLYLALDGKPSLSMLCAAVAFGFKLQAVFVLPVFAVLWMAKKIKWYHFLFFPAGYIALVLPAVLLGRPFWDTLTLYFSQTGSIGTALNYNSSSVFAFFRSVQDPALASKAGIIGAFVYMLAILLVCFFNRSRLGDRAILGAAVLFAVGIPFLLPHMHDRYFYCADILTLVLAFASWRCALAAPLTQFASLLGYHAYLKMRFLLPMRYGAMALLAVLLIAVIYFAFSLFEETEGENAPPPQKKKTA